MKKRWWPLLILPALGLALWPCRQALTPEGIAAWTSGAGVAGGGGAVSSLFRRRRT